MVKVFRMARRVPLILKIGKIHPWIREKTAPFSGWRFRCATVTNCHAIPFEPKIWHGYYAGMFYTFLLFLPFLF